MGRGRNGGSRNEGSTVGNASDNQIVAVFYGAMVTTGKYSQSGPENHDNMFSTLLGRYNLSQFECVENAAMITDVF